MSARLSPAANLLRNSKLFALPPAVALPPVPPSSDQVAQSDTATTVYPTHAAIQTPSISLSRGDWGFKRPLPLKSTTKTSNPSVRLVRGIDTAEHVADFESAGDHVLTLRKFQDLNIPLRLPEQTNRAYDRRDFSVFRESHDNTTNLATGASTQGQTHGLWPNLKPEHVQQQLPEHIRKKQSAIDESRAGSKATADPSPSGIEESTKITEQRRWRYAGPSLIQISGMEFELFLKSLGPKHRAQLRERAKQELIRERAEAAREEGRMDKPSTDVSEAELSEHIRALRTEPKKFGPLLAEILDLPEGQIPAVRRSDEADPWEYGRDTLAAAEWREKGPPRTHPSAGLSYIHTTTISNNHPKFGPQKNAAAVLARAIKYKTRNGPPLGEFGVAGFVVPRPVTAGTHNAIRVSEALSGGPKVAVVPGAASITERGALNLNVLRTHEYVSADNKATHELELRQEREARGEPEPDVQPAPYFSRQRQQPTRRAVEIKKRERIEPSQDVDNILAQMMELRKKD